MDGDVIRGELTGLRRRVNFIGERVVCWLRTSEVAGSPCSANRDSFWMGHGTDV